MKKIIKKYWFIVLFGITLLVPIYGKVLDKKVSLSGVTESSESVKATVSTVGDGTYQAYLNDKWDNNFPGRKALLKLRNQFLYSVFKESPNNNVVIGKKNYLFEPAYILFETQIYAPAPEEYFETLGNNLKQLNTLLEDNGKELYIFITPSKAHFCKDYIPNRYMFLNYEGSFLYTNYSKLIETLNKYKINYWDSIAFIEENKDSGILESPIFYASGTHWDHTWGETCAANFLNYMNKKSKYGLGEVSVYEKQSKDPVFPDTDLYSTLNLFLDADETWYSAEMLIDNEGKDKPNIFLRGGSFMGQSLNALIVAGLFGKDVHFENNYYFTNQYTSSYTLPDYNAYDEIDLNELVGQSDIIVLEVNEAAISGMSWGFIEYLLEHPDYLDYNP